MSSIDAFSCFTNNGKTYVSATGVDTEDKRLGYIRCIISQSDGKWIFAYDFCHAVFEKPCNTVASRRRHQWFTVH